jgi:hypothetical protein
MLCKATSSPRPRQAAALPWVRVGIYGGAVLAAQFLAVLAVSANVRGASPEAWPPLSESWRARR